MAFLASQAAADALPAEGQCVMHFNKSFYVSGEIAWYKIYFPIHFKGRDIAVRVGVWGQGGQMIWSVFHKTSGQPFVQGYCQIPFDLQSGLYHFVVSGTNLASKEPVVLAEALIPVYNDLQKEAPPAAGTPQQRTADKREEAALPEASLQLSIELLPDSIQRREKVRARIRIRDENGKPVSARLSVSVRDYALTEINIPGQKNIIKGKLLEPGIALTLDSAMSFQGSISDSLGQALKVPVLGVYSSKEQVFRYVKSDDEGRFSFSLPDFSGSQPIQFLDYQYKDIKVAIRPDIQLEEKGELVYTPEVLSYLNTSRQRKKIFQAHDGFEYVLEQETPSFNIRPLIPDNSYRIQDFEHFGPLPMFFREIATALKFREGENGRFIAKMFNAESGNRSFYKGKPLFIINGKLTWDADFVARLDIAQIEEVGLFHNRKKLRQRFNALGAHGGVVTIKAKQPGLQVPASEEEDIFLVNGLQPKAAFPGSPAGEEAIAPHAPFLQPQLYWGPDLQTDEQGELLIGFTQSDDLSIFCIEIVAQGQNGAWGYGRVDYRVYP